MADVRAAPCPRLELFIEAMFLLAWPLEWLQVSTLGWSGLDGIKPSEI